MKSKIAVLFLIVLLCLTSGCSNTSQIAEQPAPVSSSESNKAPYQSETAQATEKTEVEQPRSIEPKDDDRSTEATVGVLDSSIQTKPASEQPNSGTTPPQVFYGRYFVKETKAPEGFVLDTGVYEVMIDTDGKT